jgi:hypothetical protein
MQIKIDLFLDGPFVVRVQKLQRLRIH